MRCILDIYVYDIDFFITKLIFNVLSFLPQYLHLIRKVKNNQEGK